MVLTDLPEEPWHKVGTDLFHLDGRHYLLVIDYYSNYPEVVVLPNISAVTGIPHVVYSDNGPCYSCQEFHEFAVDYDFLHITSSPLFPQSNGKAEKRVQIVKHLLRKAKDSHADPHLALLNYRASPLEHGVSPAELLMGRRLRTTLPFRDAHGVPQDLGFQRRSLQLRQKRNYDKSTRSLEPLVQNDTVRVGDSGRWSRRAAVLGTVGPRSYVVRTEDGQTLRRNRRDLLKTQETLQGRDSISEPVSCGLRRTTRIIKPPERLNL
uniref:Integrase catalytic domain-containing protein n=1 Tax=Nothobranchius furzeri TaxID=105023 RepID=A0A8C6MIL3_NOTFU